MKPGDVYRRAAMMIMTKSKTEGACYAIYLATKSYSSAPYTIATHTKAAFESYFKPENPMRLYWYGDFTPETQLARQLALLFMAEIVEDDVNKKAGN